MEGNNPEDEYGIDHVETPDDVMGVDIGYGRKSSAVKNAEENPDKPFNSKVKGKNGQNRGAGEMLASGEKNQESDKDGSSKEGWSNKTGTKMKLATQAATGNVAGLAKTVKNNGGIKGTAKTVGPIATILIILAAGIGLTTSTGSLLLPSLVENIFLNYDSQSIITNIKSKIIFKMQMKGSIDTKSKWADLTRHQKKKLAESNIEVVDVRSGLHKYRVLKYNEGDGKVSYVAADADDAAKVKSKLGDYEVSDLESKLKTDNDFFVKYQDGTATWRTSVATMFDKVSDIVFGKMKLSRNTYTDVEEKAPADGDYEKAKAAVDEDFEEEFDQATRGDTDIEASKHGVEEETDEETGEVKQRPTEEVGTTKFSEGDSEADIEQKIKAVGGAADADLDSPDAAAGGGSAVGILSNIAEGTCQGYNILSGMNRMIKAYEKVQVVAMGIKLLEAIQRMQAGDGGGDVIADVVGNMLIQIVTQRVKLQRSSDNFGGDEYVDLTGSVMSSDPISSLFGGAQLTSNNPAVKALIVPDSSIRRILNSISGNSGNGYKACSIANLAANFIDVIANIATLGTTTIIGALIGMGQGLLKGIIMSGLVAFFVPRIATMLTRNFDALTVGVIGGAVILWAASAVLSKNAQASGFRPATEVTLIRNAQLKQEIMADEMRYAKLTKSPFDISSPYTFMGTLIRTVGAGLTKNNSLTSSINTFTNVTAKSLTAFVPGAYAANMSVDDLNSLGECTDLNQMNSSGGEPIGDAFCEMRAVGNTTRNGLAPDIVTKYLQDNTCQGRTEKAFGDDFDPSKQDFDKNLKISSESCLGLFLKQYTQRDAPLGDADPDIADSYRVSSGNAVIDMLGSGLSLGVLDFINSLQDVRYLPNVIGNEYTDPGSPNAAYYDMAEQFIVGERMREAATGGEERNAVSVFLEDYYKEHPLDNSFEGVIARYSGLSKKQVSFFLELGEEIVFLADYHPESLYPLAQVEEKPAPKFKVEENGTTVFVVNVPYIILEVPTGKRNTTA